MSKKKKNQRLRAFSHRVEYLATRLGIFIFGGMSPSARYELALTLGGVVAAVAPFRAADALESLRTAFPDRSERELRKLLPGIYANVILLGLESMALIRATPAEIVATLEHPLEDDGWVDRLSSGEGPVILATAHLGNWEWGGAYMAVRGMKVTGAAKPMHNPHVDRMVDAMRTRVGLRITSTRESPRHLIKLVREGYTPGIPPDQDARRDGIFADFFGQPASTATGPAWLAYKFGLPLVPIWLVRTPSGRFRALASEAAVPDRSKPQDAEVRRLTEHYLRCLEEMIRRYPEQYMWFHRRWKTRPRPEDLSYRQASEAVGDSIAAD